MGGHADEKRTAIRRRHARARDRVLDGLTIAPVIGGKPTEGRDSMETGEPTDTGDSAEVGDTTDTGGTAETIATRDPATGEPITEVPICDAFSRALVHEDIYDEFVERFVAKSESYVLGDPLNEATTMGPLTTAEGFENVTEYIGIGEREGATLETGGGRPDDPALADGLFVEPTVFTGVDNDMRVASEEIFGLVQTIQMFGSYEEAIALANDTEFGLAAGIATESTDLTHAAAADIDAGVIYVNAYGPIRPEGPYGRVKKSGIGRDLGEAALTHYWETKTVYVNLDDPTL